MLKKMLVLFFVFLPLNIAFAFEQEEGVRKNQSIYLSNQSFQEIFIDNIEKDYLYVNQIKNIIIDKESYTNTEFQLAVKNILIQNKIPEKRSNRIANFLTKMTYEENSFNLYFYNAFINFTNLSTIVKKV